MSEEREQLRAIVEHPEDRAPRRAYADWLVARGGPRGEYIRASRELTRVSVYDPRWHKMYEQSRPSFRESLALLGLDAYFPCPEGLPDKVLVDAARYTTEGHDPAFLATATKLTVSHPHAWPFALLASPWLNGVTELTCRTEEESYSTDGIGEAGARALASALREPRLIKLDLGGNAIGDAGAAALAASPGLTRLKDLWLSGGFDRDYLVGPPPSNHIGDEGARALADSPNLPALAWLNLAYNFIGDDGARAFAASTSLPSLKVLCLRNNRIGHPGAWALVDSPLVDRLNHLDLSNNRIGLNLSPFCDWDGTIVGGQYHEDTGDPEWPQLRPRLLRFLPIDFPRHGEPLPPG